MWFINNETMCVVDIMTFKVYMWALNDVVHVYIHQGLVLSDIVYQ